MTTDLRELAAVTALNEMMSQRYFSICTIDNVGQMLGRNPRGEECEWRSGPPPEIGWWPASVIHKPELLRYWNGKRWSECANHSWAAESAGASGKLCVYDHRHGIEWTDRWWLK